MPIKTTKRRKPTVRQRLTKLIKELEALRCDTASKPDDFQSELTNALASLEQAYELTRRETK